MAESPSKGIPFTQLSSIFQGTSKPRLHALYADIARQKHSNPTAFQSNVAWWRNILEALVARGWQSGPNTSQGDRLILHANPSLAENLRYEGVGKPLGLGTVIAELDDTLALVPLTSFLSSPTSIYTPASLPWRVASYVVGKPLWWALQQVGIVDDDGGGSEGERERWKRVVGPHVVLRWVEIAANSVLFRQHGRRSISVADSLYSMESFRAEFAQGTLENITLSELDMKVLVKFLERERRAVVVDKNVIKFVDEYAEKREVTEVDKGILELKDGIGALHAQVAEIDRRIEERTSQISEALRAKRKELAMNYLRSRKQLQELYSRRLNSLEQLQATLGSVEGAAGDVEIMKSYESATATLKAILAHPLLQREKIDETMDALAEATAEQREINGLIRAGGEAYADVQPDEEEIAAELDALTRDVEREQREEVEMAKVAEEQRLRALSLAGSGAEGTLRIGAVGLKEASDGDSEWEQVSA